jgi:hypothetical protein
MSTAAPQTKAPPLSKTPAPERELSPLAALLSYLVPGLGQVYQGRVGKGILFFVCIYTLFFYGMYLGSWSNVFLPDSSAEHNPWDLPPLAADLYNRPQFAGQFWVGVAAWPAVIQYAHFDPARERHPLLGTLQRAPYESRSNLRPPDEYAHDPADRAAFRRTSRIKTSEALADWPGKTLNELQTDGDKTWDLGWVFTVIAGVLNVLVIYDALAGPAFLLTEPKGAAGLK